MIMKYVMEVKNIIFDRIRNIPSVPEGIGAPACWMSSQAGSSQ